MSKKKILISLITFTAIIAFLIFMINMSHKYNGLIITEDKWNTIKESRTENVNLILESIEFNGYKLIIDEKNNTLYYSLINESNSKYNPNVSYTTNSNNVKLVVLLDEITDEKVKSNQQFQMMIYDENDYHIYNLKCTDFPILNISYDENEKDKQKNISMKMYLLDNLSDIPNKVIISDGKFKINEDNYIFSLHMLTPGKNKRNHKISILNMKPHSEYILKPINDVVENENHRVELFLNNEYKGVYSLGYIEEKIPNDNVKPKDKNRTINQ